jgi:hypothetical protein
MAAKKAPAKKMAAPKAAPKRTSKTADSSKLTASQKKNLAASAKMRTDAAGRSGMGETGTSNVKLDRTSSRASATASAAFWKASDKVKARGGSSTAAYNAGRAASMESFSNAQKYAAYSVALRSKAERDKAAADAAKAIKDRSGMYTTAAERAAAAAKKKKKK